MSSEYADPAPARAGPRGLGRREWGVLALVAAVGALNLPMPFGGDQAMFVVYARAMDAGLELYRDVWDSKPPGMYLLYVLAGKLFGFNQLGAHLLELLYLLAFSAVVLRTSRDWLARRGARLALPPMTVGIYYLIAEPKQMVQAEVLAGLPIYLALWSSTLGRSPAAIRRWAFASGFAGGAVIWLKMYFLPILGAIWALTLFRARREPGGLSRALARRIGWTAAGFALPVLALALWVAAHGVVAEFAWTAFVYPGSAIAQLEHDFARMRQVGLWFGSSFAVALAFAGWAVCCTAFAGRRSGGMFAGALCALLVTLLLVFGEKSWWKYYALILVVPLGLLASIGLDDALSRTGRRGKIALAVLSLALVVAPLRHFAWKANALRRANFALTREDRTEFRKAMHRPYRESLPEVEFIERFVEPDQTVHVFGDPLILMLAGRTNAVPINGWAPQTWSPEMWRTVLDQLRAERPDYVYMTTFVARLSSRHFPELVDYVRDEYDLVVADGTRAWFRRSELAEPPGAAARGN
jgi:hypothetical protein